MSRRPVRNPSFPTGLVLGAVAGAAALAWWATRRTAMSTVQALVESGAGAQALPADFLEHGGLPGLPVAYAGDNLGHALTAAEAEAMGLGLAPMDARRATLTAAMQRAADPVLSSDARAAAARLVAQLQGSPS